MYPILDLGIIRIPMYTLMMFFGGLAFIGVMYWILAKREHVTSRTFIRLFIVCIPGAIVMYGAAFFFNSLFHSIEAGELRIGGITWLGGVVGSFPVMIYLIHRFVPAAKGNALTYFSLLLPGIVLAHALGRVGCFFAGCCYGSVTDSIFGVSFPETSHAAHQYPSPSGGSLPVLPTQLFEAVFELVLFVIMIAFYKKTRKHNIELYCIVYGIFRFAMEFLRGDDRGTTGVLAFTPAQLLCVIMWIAAVCLILFKKNLLFKKLYRKCEVWQAEIKIEAIRQRKAHGAKAALDTMEALRELKRIYDEGILTEAEYEEKRQKLTKSL